MSSSTTDAAAVLRDAIKSAKQISFSVNEEPASELQKATHIIIAPHSFPKSTPTRFRKVDVPNPTGPSDFYSLEALYLAWYLKDASGADYMRQARENGIHVSASVSVTARKRVLDWLEGRIDDGDLIVSISGSTATPATSPKQPTSGHAAQTSQRKAIPDTPSTSAKRRYVPDPADMEAVKKIKRNEIELRDRNAVLRGIKPNNFNAIKTVFSDKLKKLRDVKPGASTSLATPVADKMQARKVRSNFPIIMVSSSPTAIITMHNVKRFLQEAIFETSQEAREKGNTEKLVTIDRKLTHIDPSGKEWTTQTRYIVVDSHESLAKFGADAWDRVVCVMTTGQAWQFKPYRWSEPRILFHHVKGIYFSWTNDPPNTKIKDWNVADLKIDQSRRHVDKAVVASFWKLLDTWMMSNKPGLMPK